MKAGELRIRQLRLAAETQESIWSVHYACESFYAVTDRPVAVSCISFVNMATSEDVTFSMTDKKADQERYVLESFYAFLRENSDTRIVHWNMNRSDFGFQALENRYEYITDGKAPGRTSQDRLYDLDALIESRYGRGYVDHSKLYNMAKLNEFRTRYLLTGKEEAEKFDNHEHGDIRRSATEKARLIAFLAKRLLQGTLETKTAGAFINFAGGMVDSIQVALAVGERFRYVARQLERRHNDRETLKITDEYDVQDLFHGLLRLFFEDVRREEWTPSYAGGSNRMDFLLKEYRLAIELKHTRPSMTARKLGEELTIDVDNYQQHPDVRHLVCLVLDPGGRIENPRGIEGDLTQTQDNLAVTVRIFDAG